eukprot:4328966-Ditylum_brightwellii.AAC.1
MQQSIIKLSDKAKGRDCYDLDMVDASGHLKFSKGQVQYLKMLVKQVRRLDGGDVDKSDTDQLVNYFESLKNCRYTILYNDPESLVRGNHKMYL